VVGAAEAQVGDVLPATAAATAKPVSAASFLRNFIMSVLLWARVEPDRGETGRRESVDPSSGLHST
jgi:hypothetical protein